MKMFGRFVGFVSGVISIIFAFIVKGKSLGSYESNMTYGGAAYSGIQQASAQSANNVRYLSEIVRTGLFAFLLVLGIALIGFFLSQSGGKSAVSDSVQPEATPVDKED